MSIIGVMITVTRSAPLPTMSIFRFAALTRICCVDDDIGPPARCHDGDVGHRSCHGRDGVGPWTRCAVEDDGPRSQHTWHSSHWIQMMSPVDQCVTGKVSDPESLSFYVGFDTPDRYLTPQRSNNKIFYGSLQLKFTWKEYCHRSKIQCLRLYWWWRDQVHQVCIRWTDRFRFYRKIQYVQYQCVWQRYKRLDLTRLNE